MSRSTRKSKSKPSSNKNRTEHTGLLVERPRWETRDGLTVLHLRLRSRHFSRKDGESVEHYDHIDIEVRGAYATEVAPLLDQRMVVEVVGRLEIRKRPVEVGGKFIYEHKGRVRKKKTYAAATVVARKVEVLGLPQATKVKADRGQSDSPFASSAAPGANAVEDGQPFEGVAS